MGRLMPLHTSDHPRRVPGRKAGNHTHISLLLLCNCLGEEAARRIRGNQSRRKQNTPARTAGTWGPRKGFPGPRHKKNRVSGEVGGASPAGRSGGASGSSSETPRGTLYLLPRPRVNTGPCHKPTTHTVTYPVPNCILLPHSIPPPFRLHDVLKLPCTAAKTKSWPRPCAVVRRRPAGECYWCCRV